MVQTSIKTILLIILRSFLQPLISKSVLLFHLLKFLLEQFQSFNLLYLLVLLLHFLFRQFYQSCTFGWSVLIRNCWMFFHQLKNTRLLFKIGLDLNRLKFSFGNFYNLRFFLRTVNFLIRSFQSQISGRFITIFNSRLKDSLDHLCSNSLRHYLANFFLCNGQIYSFIRLWHKILFDVFIDYDCC